MWTKYAGIWHLVNDEFKVVTLCGIETNNLEEEDSQPMRSEEEDWSEGCKACREDPEGPLGIAREREEAYRKRTRYEERK